MTKKNTNEIFEGMDEQTITHEDKPKKKPKKEVSAERRAILLAQLKKGRETAKQNRLANRNKKTEEPQPQQPQQQQLKPQVSTENIKLHPQEKVKPQVKEAEPEIKKTWSIHDDINNLKYQLRELKNMMNKSKTVERVEAKIEKIIEKKEIIEEKQTTPNPKPPSSNPIPIPQQTTQRIVKSLFKKPMW